MLASARESEFDRILGGTQQSSYLLHRESLLIFHRQDAALSQTQERRIENLAHGKRLWCRDSTHLARDALIEEPKRFLFPIIVDEKIVRNPKEIGAIGSIGRSETRKIRESPIESVLRQVISHIAIITEMPEKILPYQILVLGIELPELAGIRLRCFNQHPVFLAGSEPLTERIDQLALDKPCRRTSRMISFRVAFGCEPAIDPLDEAEIGYFLAGRREPLEFSADTIERLSALEM